MSVAEILNSVLAWSSQRITYLTKRLEIQDSYTSLLKSLLEAEQKRHIAELKTLQLERELQVQREKLGRDLHDGFGSQLTHLISRLELLAYHKSPDPNQLLRLSEFTREMNHTLRETIWLLDQEQITGEALGGRMHGLLLKVWEDRELPYLKWQFHDLGKKSEVRPLIAMHLLRIAQEGTINALKYAFASQINVTLEISQTDTSLTITDDGQGLHDVTYTNGFGLNNLRKRAEEVNGTFFINSTASGTYIKVVLPLNA
ncbi:sensor histidine kinase [Rufibacter psychrotolerans]|uniref:sensor histidine kinase n=1 Tax=Rufibacter psychrotolerans TaxID=2812556 RepID=UPI00196725BE|nr:ATP-binding protein [Rufibacter sp. SYSU D00308]